MFIPCASNNAVVILFPCSTLTVASVASSPFSFFPINSTSYTLIFHIAYNTWFFVAVTFVVSSILLPFVLLSYHPTNVYPSFVGVGNVPYSLLYFTSFLFVSSWFPPFTSNVTVYVASSSLYVAYTFLFAITLL